MPPRGDKEWQAQLEVMEKRVMDSIEKLDKKVSDSTQDLLGKMVENISKSNAKLMEDFKEIIISEMKEVRKEMGELRTEMGTTKEKVKDVETKVQEMEEQIKNIKAEKDKMEMKYEIKIRELQLRFRGLEEEEGEDVRDTVVKLVAEILDIKVEAADKELDHVFRFKSWKTNRGKFPGDVIVNILSRRVKDNIIRQNKQNPIEYKGKRVQILREMPRQVIIERKSYRELTDKLKKQGVRFRWEMPLGLSFSYDNAQHRITSTEQMTKFLNDYGKDFEQ